MAAPDTEMGGLRKGFPTTLWTIVLRARNPDSPEGRAALEALIHAYWKPVYFYLRRKGNTYEQSKDLTQGFFAAVLERNSFRVAEESRGRFRKYLLVLLKNFLSDEYDRATAQKRGGGRKVFSLDYQGAETDITWTPASKETPEEVYRQEWALGVMNQAWEILREEYRTSDELKEFEILNKHLSFTAERSSYSEMAEQLGVSETDIKNRYTRARTRLARAVMDVLRACTETEEDAQEELKELLTAFR